MSYRQNKKKSYKKFLYFFIGVIFLFALFLFTPILPKGGQASSWFVFQPLVVLKNNMITRFHNWGVYFASKKNLALENENLKTQIMKLESEQSNYSILVKENQDLKNILGRKSERNFILGNILVKPNRSFYDTLLVDVGSADGVKMGAKVFAFGAVPLGYVAETSLHTSSIVLYSTSKEKTDVVENLSGATLEAIGRGAGNFEIILPRDFDIQEGEAVYLPGLPYVLANVQGVISDPRDSFKKALLKSPVNIFDLRFVEIEK